MSWWNGKAKAFPPLLSPPQGQGHDAQRSVVHGMYNAVLIPVADSFPHPALGKVIH